MNVIVDNYFLHNETITKMWKTIFSTIHTFFLQVLVLECTPQRG